MIVVTITIEEDAEKIASRGIVTGIEATEKEDQMARDILKAIERQCMSRKIEGSIFVRRDLPSDGKSV